MIYLVIQAPKRTLRISSGLSSSCKFVEAKSEAEAIRVAAFDKDNNMCKPYARPIDYPNTFYI